MSTETEALIGTIRTYLAAPRGWSENGMPGLVSILDNWEVAHAPFFTPDEALRAQYPEVDRFAKRMRAELSANSHKGNQGSWLRMSLKEAWIEISWHLGKLTAAMKAEDVSACRELAADIANGAMMFDDIILAKIAERDGA